jgi:hypothetical protein
MIFQLMDEGTRKLRKFNVRIGKHGFATRGCLATKEEGNLD